MQSPSPFEPLAHVRKTDNAKQALQSHLLYTAELAGTFAKKAGLFCCGRLLGLLHDLGKYSEAFRRYLASNVGLLDQDHDDFLPNASAYKGKIDHSTSGAQYVNSRLQRSGANGRLLARMPKSISKQRVAPHAGVWIETWRMRNACGVVLKVKNFRLASPLNINGTYCFYTALADVRANMVMRLCSMFHKYT